MILLEDRCRSQPNLDCSDCPVSADVSYCLIVTVVIVCTIVVSIFVCLPRLLHCTDFVLALGT